MENATLYRNYERQKIALRERTSHYKHAPIQLPSRRGSSNGDHALDDGINEFRLWHGTNPDTSGILATAGFDERVAELSGLYGAGSYFADAMCKSNQYARQVNLNGEHCMLCCRVTMGFAFKTPRVHKGERRPPNNSATPGAPFDSIFAEAGVANGGKQLHNEYVVFRHDQVYPEYIIWYTTDT